MLHVEAERCGCAKCFAVILGLRFAAMATIAQATDDTECQKLFVPGAFCQMYCHEASPTAPGTMSCIVKAQNKNGLPNSKCRDVSEEMPGKSRAQNPPWAAPCGFCSSQHISSKLEETMMERRHPRATSPRAHLPLLLMQETLSVFGTTASYHPRIVHS